MGPNPTHAETSTRLTNPTDWPAHRRTVARTSLVDTSHGRGAGLAASGARGMTRRQGPSTRSSPEGRHAQIQGANRLSMKAWPSRTIARGPDGTLQRPGWTDRPSGVSSSGRRRAGCPQASDGPPGACRQSEPRRPASAPGCRSRGRAGPDRPVRVTAELDDQQQPRAGRWTRPPLPVQTGGGGVDLGLEIVTARGGQIAVRAAALSPNKPRNGCSGYGSTRPLSDIGGRPGAVGGEYPREHECRCEARPQQRRASRQFRVSAASWPAAASS